MADDKDKVVGGVSGFSVLIILAVIFSFWLANNDPNAIKNQSGSGSGSGFGSGNTFSSQTANQQLTSSERAENISTRVVARQKFTVLIIIRSISIWGHQPQLTSQIKSM